jgi:ABC transporter substrate binding protein
LRELGLVEGQHFVIDFSLAQSSAQIPDAAAELVHRKVDIIVASGTPSVLPARDVAGQTPVVFVAGIDPVAAGLVASLARPGGNITGMTTISTDVIAKRLQMVRELLPKLTKVALLVRESSPETAQYVNESKTAARNLGIELQIEIERDPKDLEGVSRSHHRTRDEWADARHGHHPSTTVVTFRQRLDLIGHGFNSLIELPPVADKIIDDAYHAWRKNIRPLGQNVRPQMAKEMQSLPDDDAALQEKAANLIDHCGPFAVQRPSITIVPPKSNSALLLA